MVPPSPRPRWGDFLVPEGRRFYGSGMVHPWRGAARAGDLVAEFTAASDPRRSPEARYHFLVTVLDHTDAPRARTRRWTPWAGLFYPVLPSCRGRVCFPCGVTKKIPCLWNHTPMRSFRQYYPDTHLCQPGRPGPLPAARRSSSLWTRWFRRTRPRGRRWTKGPTDRRRTRSFWRRLGRPSSAWGPRCETPRRAEVRATSHWRGG